MRKFANAWRSLTWEKILRRKANGRRQQFSETLRTQAKKKKEKDEELQAIFAAVEESKRIQRQQQDQAEIQQEVNEMIAARKKQWEATHGIRKVAGLKRKSPSRHDEPRGSLNGINPRPSTPSHKRSRTVGASSEPSHAISQFVKALDAPAPQGNHSILIPRSSSQQFESPTERRKQRFAEYHK